MLTIIHNQTYYNIDYDPKETLTSLKQKISSLINLPSQRITVLHENKPLLGDTSLLETLIHDDVILHIQIEHPKSSFISAENLESMFDLFPALKKEVEKNKDLKEIVQSGNLQEEMEKMQSNPHYMKEQLKNVDIAMSKLENIPGGINMMSSMVKDVSDPLTEIFRGKGKSFREGENRNEVIREPINADREKVNYFVLYVEQLKVLREVGFFDVKRNVDALKKCDGDVENAILMLANENDQ